MYLTAISHYIFLVFRRIFFRTAKIILLVVITLQLGWHPTPRQSYVIQAQEVNLKSSKVHEVQATQSTINLNIASEYNQPIVQSLSARCFIHIQSEAKQYPVLSR